MNLNVQKMTITEKLQTMEMLWDEICRNASELESPAWQGKIIQHREEHLKQGKDSFEDWEQAKKDIRKSTC
ncbi:MAG: addiction module protein [Desulfobulbaceae bacterium]|nr:addiction module protein [Desulfobulbaceae bacterium]